MAAFLGLSMHVGAELAAPELTPRAADSAVALDVTVTCPTPGAEIRYTLNGSEPTRHDPLISSGGTIRIARHSVVKAKAWLGSETSGSTTEDYRITGAIVSGYQHGMALSVSGRIWSWGSQGSGRLGNGLTAAADVPVPGRVRLGAGNFENGAALSAGYDHSLVIDQNRKLWAFGENGLGQLGDNTSTDRALPVQVLRSTLAGDFLENCVAADAAESFSVALTASGEVLSWGTQATGRLGNGQSNSNSRRFAGPVNRGDDPLYPDLVGMRGVAAGNAFGLAREPHSSELAEAAGRVWVWGHNHVGQLGLGHQTSTQRALPMKLDATRDLTDAISIDAGGTHSVVLRWKEDDPDLAGTVWSSGKQDDGRLGNGSVAVGNALYPVRAIRADGSPLTGIRQISAGAGHTLALDQDGYVWAWGNNRYGQLGDGTMTHSGHARMVKNAAGTAPMENIVMVAAGGDGIQGSSMALAEDGTIWVWGRNDHGQLGTGGTAFAATLPVAHAQNHIAEGTPSLSLSHSVIASMEQGSVEITATPAHSGPAGLEEIDRVEIFLNGALAATLTEGSWTTQLADLAAGSYHAYGIVRDVSGLVAMSAPLQFDIALDPAKDRDGDGLKNGQETTLGTDPWNPDSDGDGMLDGYEHWHQFSPLIIEVGSKGPTGDFDGDGVKNLAEQNLGRTAKLRSEAFLINPTNPGPDGFVARWFGVTTYWYTIEYSTNLIQWTRYPWGFMGENAELSVDVAAWYGAPLPSRLFVRLNWGPAATEDIDGDGLAAADEFAFGSDPTRADTDGDGLDDGVERTLGTDPNDTDTDDDGIPDQQETTGGTDPTRHDTDGDGSSDGAEVGAGKNPNSNTSFPPQWRYVEKTLSAGYGEVVTYSFEDPTGSTEVYSRVVTERGWDPPATNVSEFETEVSWADLGDQLEGEFPFPLTPPENSETGLGRFGGEGYIIEYGEPPKVATLGHRRYWLVFDEALVDGYKSTGLILTKRSINYTEDQEESEAVDIIVPPGMSISEPIDLEMSLITNPPWDSAMGYEGVEQRLLPVEVTAAFGEGPNQLPPDGPRKFSREILEDYLDGIKVARQGNVWAVSGKDAQGNDKIWGVEIVSDQAKLNAALSSGGRYVVFDGHSNFGLGPDFGGIYITKIADLTNYGVKYTDVPLNFRLRGSANDTTKWGDPFIHMQIGDNEIPAAPTNYNPVTINEERFPNIDGVGVGQAFQKQGQGFDTWHYRVQGGAKRLMIDAPRTDLPANLAYKTFFYNACSSGVDYIENFKKGDFIYTKETCRVHQATRVFVQGVIEGKTTEQIMPSLNQPQIGGGENVYAFERF